MNIKILKPKQSLNKAYQRRKPIRSEFENFKARLKELLSSLDPKRDEEHNKKFISEFLEKTFYSFKNEILK